MRRKPTTSGDRRSAREQIGLIGKKKLSKGMRVWARRQLALNKLKESQKVFSNQRIQYGKEKKKLLAVMQSVESEGLADMYELSGGREKKPKFLKQDSRQKDALEKAFAHKRELSELSSLDSSKLNAIAGELSLRLEGIDTDFSRRMRKLFPPKNRKMKIKLAVLILRARKLIGG